MMHALTRGLIGLIALALALGTIAPSTAVAGIVGTDEVVSERQAASDRERIEQALEREEAREALASFGVDREEAKERVAALSDEEAAELAQRIEQQPAGAGVSISATAILLIVIIWLLVR